MFSNAKAIETKYKGYKFRSRLEARWAVYLDAIGWEWLYEPEGFDLDGIRYLPDFLISGMSDQGNLWKLWLEIKPEKPNEIESVKAEKLVMHTGIDLVFGIGIPDPEKLTHGLNGFFVHYPFEKIINNKLIPVPMTAPVEISLDWYCFIKWERPGYFMGKSKIDWETISACDKAKEARFEFNDSK